MDCIMPRNLRNENTYICIKSIKACIFILNILNPTEVSIFNYHHPILETWEQAQKVIQLTKVTKVEFTLCSELQLKIFFLLLYAASRDHKILGFKESLENLLDYDFLRRHKGNCKRKYEPFRMTGGVSAIRFLLIEQSWARQIAH